MKLRQLALVVSSLARWSSRVYVKDYDGGLFSLYLTLFTREDEKPVRSRFNFAATRSLITFRLRCVPTDAVSGLGCQAVAVLYRIQEIAAPFYFYCLVYGTVKHGH